MPKLLMLDDTAAHQIRVEFAGFDTAVTCVCQPDGVFFKRARRLPDDVAQQAYRKHLTDADEVA